MPVGEEGNNTCILEVSLNACSTDVWGNYTSVLLLFNSSYSKNVILILYDVTGY